MKKTETLFFCPRAGGEFLPRREACIGIWTAGDVEAARKRLDAEQREHGEKHVLLCLIISGALTV